MNDRLSVHIVAWNSMTYLPNLFATFDVQEPGFRVTVVDNASTDGTASWASSVRPQTGVLRNMRNMGFARAHNQAIRLALAAWADQDLSMRYVLVCNPDIELAPRCLDTLVAFMDAHPEYAACAPKLLRAYLRPSGDGQTETERSPVIDAVGICASKGRRFTDRGAGEEDRGQYDEAVDVFGASGACACFRASALVQAEEGGCGQFFDEDFFAYKEDVDLAWRMRRLGFRTAAVPSAVAWHHRRAPATHRGNLVADLLKRRRKPPFVNYLSARNHVWLLAKHLAWSDAILHGLWIFPYELGKMLAALASWSTLRGYGAAVLGLPKMLAKRLAFARRRLVRPAELRHWFV